MGVQFIMLTACQLAPDGLNDMNITCGNSEGISYREDDGMLNVSRDWLETAAGDSHKASCKHVITTLMCKVQSLLVIRAISLSSFDKTY